MSKYDVIRKTGSTHRITTPPERGESHTHTQAHRQTDRQTNTLITIPRGVISKKILLSFHGHFTGEDAACGFKRTLTLQAEKVM